MPYKINEFTRFKNIRTLKKYLKRKGMKSVHEMPMYQDTFLDKSNEKSINYIRNIINKNRHNSIELTTNNSVFSVCIFSKQLKRWVHTQRYAVKSENGSLIVFYNRRNIKEL